MASPVGVESIEAPEMVGSRAGQSPLGNASLTLPAWDPVLDQGGRA